MAEPDGFDDFETNWEAAAEWGLASLVLGGTTSLFGMFGVIMSLLSHDMANRWADLPQLISTIAGYTACAVMFGFAITGLRFGTRSVRSARERRQPAARGTVGMMLSGFGLFAVLGAAGTWLGVVDRM
jgi:Na+/proline symporter